MTLWLFDHVGLAKPYRFERTVRVLFALVLTSLAVAAVIYYRQAGELSRDTPRAWYFLYLAVLLGLALLGVRWPRAAAIVLSLAALELGLGVGSDVLERLGRAPEDLLPENGPPEAPRTWHPLLQETVRPGAVRRLSNGEIRYNSLGLRGPERSRDDLRSKIVIALFGGSTTEDIAVPDGQTWAERLEQMLGPDRFAVINRGSSWYSTVELVLQTAFYGQAFGVKPDCAVYRIGGVDLQNSHFHDLDSGYAGYHTPALVDAFAARRIDEAIPSISPTLRYLGRIVALAVDTVEPVPLPRGKTSGEPDPSLEAIFVRNIATISAINRQRGITTVWIGEVMDPVTMTEMWSGAEPWAPFVRGGDVWPLLSHLNAVLKREAMALDDVYVDVPANEFTADDFVDGEHQSAAGSLKFATLVAPTIAEACRKAG